VWRRGHACASSRLSLFEGQQGQAPEEETNMVRKLGRWVVALAVLGVPAAVWAADAAATALSCCCPLCK